MSRIVTLAAVVGALALPLVAAPAASADNLMSFPTLLGVSFGSQADTTFYNTETGEQNTTTFPNECGSGHPVGVTRTGWYALRGNGGVATVTTDGSDFNTALFAYVGSAIGALVTCNDDAAVTTYTSTVTFPTTPGMLYVIQAGSFCNDDAPRCNNSVVGGDLYIAARLGPRQTNDQDGDSVPGGADCNDDDVRIHPGALDVAGDGIDQDCDGRDAVVARPRTVRTTVSLSSSVHRAYTRIARLTARNVPAGATLTVSCATKALGCRFATRTTSVRRTMTLGLGKVVGRSLTRARLKKGARLVVRVSSPGQIGSVTRFTVRKGKTPAKATLCLPPGATKPQRTCS